MVPANASASAPVGRRPWLLMVAVVILLVAAAALAYAVATRDSVAEATPAPDAETAVATAFETDDADAFEDAFADGVNVDKAFKPCLTAFLDATEFSVDGSTLVDPSSATVDVSFSKVAGQIQLRLESGTWRIVSMSC